MVMSCRIILPVVLPMDTTRILLIDDDPALLEALTETVKLFVPDAKVHTAASAPAALDILQASRFAAIISDISMPDMNGLALVREIKKHHVGIPIILISASPSMIEKSRESGAFAVIAKPFDRRHLKRVLNLAIRYGPLSGRIERGLAMTHTRIEELLALQARVQKQITLNQSVLQRHATRMRAGQDSWPPRPVR